MADAPYQLAIVSLEDGARLTDASFESEGPRGDWRSRGVRRRPQRHSVLSQSVKSLKIFLYYIGKARDTHANAMAEEYIKRSTRFAKCEMREIHPRRFDPWAKHPDAAKILLDPAGRLLDSAGFITLVEKAEREARDLVFVIGGADGLAAGMEAARRFVAGAVAYDHAA